MPSGKTIDRREFLRMGGQCSSSLLLFPSLTAFATELTTSEWLLESQQVSVVDIHAHCAFKEVEELVRGTSFDQEVQANRLLTPERMQLIADRRIDIQVLSVNQFWWYGADESLSRDIVRLHDEMLRNWCDKRRKNFVALSSVALQFPEIAADQLEYAVKELGLRGACIGANVNGRVPSEPEFNPFWAKAEELDVPVFVHPSGAKHLLREGALDGRGDLGNTIGNPLETTVFLTKMIFDGTLDRFPNLKICAAHGGGYLPSYLGRTEVACEYRRDANCANTRQPSEYLRDQIVVDSMVFSPEGLRHLYEEMGAKQIVYGSDIPFHWPDTLQIILDADYMTEDEKVDILGGNVRQLLKIS